MWFLGVRAVEGQRWMCVSRTLDGGMFGDSWRWGFVMGDAGGGNGVDRFIGASGLT